MIRLEGGITSNLNDIEKRQARKELREHLRQAAELSLSLGEENSFLEEAITSFNLFVQLEELWSVPFHTQRGSPRAPVPELFQ
jgi:hypothetical protein